MKHIFTIDGERTDAWLSGHDGSYRLLHDGGTSAVALVPAGAGDGAGDGRALLHIDGQSVPVVLAVAGDRVWVHVDGAAHAVILHDPVTFLGVGDDAAAAGTIRAPMPGTVIAVAAEPGAQVQAGETLMVIESMKLETAIKAPRDGVIATMNFAVGQSFDRDAVLVTLEGED